MPAMVSTPVPRVRSARWTTQRRSSTSPRETAPPLLLRHWPLEPASRGPRCCSCMGSRSTAADTSTSGHSSRAAGIDAHGFDLRGLRRLGRTAGLDRSLVAAPRRPRGTRRRGAVDRAGPAARPVRALARRPDRARLRPRRSRPARTCSSSRRPRSARRSRSGSGSLVGLAQEGDAGSLVLEPARPRRPVVRSPTVGEDYLADPLNQHKSTVRFAHAAFGEQRRVAAALDRLSIPTLVVHGARRRARSDRGQRGARGPARA